MGRSTRKGAAKKQEIIETALHLAENTPFEDINVSDICEAASISIGGFYHYFNRKNDILIVLFGMMEEYLASEVFPLFSKDEPIKSLKIFAHYWASHIYEHGTGFARQLTTLTPLEYDRMGHPHETRLLLAELFQAGQDLGHIPKTFEAKRMVDLFLIAIRGVVSDWARRNGSYSLVDTMDDFVRFFLTFSNFPQ